jgi:DHA1 family bicyclomycin/chloramphenicol resistance-like MFS transporter
LRPGPPPRLLLAALIAVGTAAVPIYVPALPLVAADLGASRMEVQQTVTLYLVVFAVSQLLIGPISDSVGRRRVALIGLAAFVLGGVLGAAAPNVDVLLAGRLVQAAGGAAGMVLSRTIIRDVFEGEDVARALSRVVTISALSPILSPIIGGFIADWFGWRATLWFLAAAGATVLLAVLVRLPETARDRGTKHGVANTLATYGRFLVTPSFMAYNLIAAMLTATYYAFLTGMPLVLAHELGLGASETGLWFATIPVTYLIGNAASARLGRRFGMASIMESGIIITTLGVAATLASAALLPASAAAWFVPVMLMSLGHGLGNPNANARAMTAIDTRVGTAVALLGGSQVAMASLASGSVSLAYDGTVWPVFGVMAALQTAIVALFLVARSRASG